MTLVLTLRIVVLLVLLSASATMCNDGEQIATLQYRDSDYKVEFPLDKLCLLLECLCSSTNVKCLMITKNGSLTDVKSVQGSQMETQGTSLSFHCDLPLPNETTKSCERGNNSALTVKTNMYVMNTSNCSDNNITIRWNYYKVTPYNFPVSISCERPVSPPTTIEPTSAVLNPVAATSISQTAQLTSHQPKVSFSNFSTSNGLSPVSTTPSYLENSNELMETSPISSVTSTGSLDYFTDEPTSTTHAIYEDPYSPTIVTTGLSSPPSLSTVLTNKSPNSQALTISTTAFQSSQSFTTEAPSIPSLLVSTSPSHTSESSTVSTSESSTPMVLTDTTSKRKTSTIIIPPPSQASTFSTMQPPTSQASSTTIQTRTSGASSPSTMQPTISQASSPSTAQSPTEQASTLSNVQPPTSQASTPSTSQPPNSQASTLSSVQPPTSQTSIPSNVQPPTSQASIPSTVQLPNSQASTPSAVQQSTSQASTTSTVQSPNSQATTPSTVQPPNSQASTPSTVQPPTSQATTPSTVQPPKSQASTLSSVQPPTSQTSIPSTVQLPNSQASTPSAVQQSTSQASPKSQASIPSAVQTSTSQASTSSTVQPPTSQASTPSTVQPPNSQASTPSAVQPPSSQASTATSDHLTSSFASPASAYSTVLPPAFQTSTVSTIEMFTSQVLNATAASTTINSLTEITPSSLRSKSDSTLVLAACVGGGLLVMIIITLIVCVIFCRRKRKEKSNQNMQVSETTNADGESLYVQIDQVTSKRPGKVKGHSLKDTVCYFKPSVSNYDHNHNPYKPESSEPNHAMENKRDTTGVQTNGYLASFGKYSKIEAIEYGRRPSRSQSNYETIDDIVLRVIIPSTSDYEDIDEIRSRRRSNSASGIKNDRENNTVQKVHGSTASVGPVYAKIRKRARSKETIKAAFETDRQFPKEPNNNISKVGLTEDPGHSVYSRLTSNRGINRREGITTSFLETYGPNSKRSHSLSTSSDNDVDMRSEYSTLASTRKAKDRDGITNSFLETYGKSSGSTLYTTVDSDLSQDCFEDEAQQGTTRQNQGDLDNPSGTQTLTEIPALASSQPIGRKDFETEENNVEKVDEDNETFDEITFLTSCGIRDFDDTKVYFELEPEPLEWI